MIILFSLFLLEKTFVRKKLFFARKNFCPKKTFFARKHFCPKKTFLLEKTFFARKNFLSENKNITYFLIAMIDVVLSTPAFYFSYTYDLTHSQQRLAHTTENFRDQPLIDRADHRQSFKIAYPPKCRKLKKK